MVPYHIVQTTLAQRTRFFARMMVTQVFDRQTLIERMVTDFPGLQTPDVLRVLQAFETTVERLCHEGAAVNLEGFVRFAPAIAGEFEGPGDRFDRRHRLLINASVSRTLNRRFAREALPRQRHPGTPGPIVTSVHDTATDTSNETVTRGNIVSLRGVRLKFDPANLLDGLRFVHADDSSVWVPITRFHRLVPSECVFLMPEVDFPRGYFELSNCLQTSQARMTRSLPLVVQ